MGLGIGDRERKLRCFGLLRKRMEKPKGTPKGVDSLRGVTKV